MIGIQRALGAGAEAIHLEEPEFWLRGGYSEGFRREGKSYFNENWQPPHSSVDAQWRASKPKFFPRRRALQQVFDHTRITIAIRKAGPIGKIWVHRDPLQPAIIGPRLL